MTGRPLVESFLQSAPLKVDREAGVIYGARLLGPTSRNTHGRQGVTGTDYTPNAHNDVRRMYEGMPLNLNHIRDDNKERQVQDAFAKVKNTRTIQEHDGPTTYGDLHYLKNDPMSAKVCEDVERGLGLYSISHAAFIGKERVDRDKKRLVIESVAHVKSIDLVIGAATNKNLWESETPPQPATLREILVASKLPPGKAGWRSLLLEDAGMAMSIDTATDVTTDPDEALAAGFRTAIVALLDDKGLSLDDKKNRIGMLLTVQDKLASGVDPSAPEVTAMAETLKVETIDPAEHAALKEKLALLEADKAATDAVRLLCETVKFTPTAVQISALKGLPDDPTRKALIESFKPVVEPKSGYTGKPATPTDTDYKPAMDDETFAQRVCG